MRNAFSRVTTATLVLAGVMGGSMAQAGLLSDYNLVVLGNLTSTSEVEGRTFVGGNLSGTSNYGTRLTPATDFLGIDSVVVGGNVINTIQINGGRLRHAGSLNSPPNMNGGGAIIQDASVSSLVTQHQAELNSTSSFLASLAANSTATVPMGQPSQLLFNATPQGPNQVAVFNISAATLFDNNLVQSIAVNFNGAQSVIINVSGTSVNWTNGNMVGDLISAFGRSHVLFNFHQAQNMNLGGFAFSGAILAPSADLTFTGVIDGSVAVENLIQRGEVHLPNYQGFLPSPGAAALLGLGAIAAGRRRRAQ